MEVASKNMVGANRGKDEIMVEREDDYVLSVSIFLCWGNSSTERILLIY